MEPLRYLRHDNQRIKISQPSQSILNLKKM